MKKFSAILFVTLFAGPVWALREDTHLNVFPLGSPTTATQITRNPVVSGIFTAGADKHIVSSSVSDEAIDQIAPEVLWDLTPSISPSDANDTGGGSLSLTGVVPPALIRVAEQPPRGVQWKPLMEESNFYLGIMHSFRIVTEPSTRNALHNGVLGGYFKALGAMHGWSDGDGYYENYLGHPLEGAASGYLWIHNDPRYRTVEFGRSRDYWMSRLRAYAFAWAFSEQFEIGPLSEASIGQIQRYCCAYGFVDHVVTPNAGMVWLVGEDIIDKYVVRRIEDHTNNTVARIIARVALNPPQSFANVLAGQVPWHRDNRPGVRQYDGALYQRFKSSADLDNTSALPLVPKFELTAAMPSVFQIGDHSCIGGGGIGGLRLTDFWQWTAEVSGCTLGGSLPKKWSGDSLTFTTGPEWILHTAGRWSPHFHARVGGQKVTENYEDPVLKKKVLDALPPGANPNSVYYDYHTQYERTGLSLSIGGGLDVGLNRGLALRLGDFDYVRSWLGHLNGVNFDHGFRFSTGLVLRLGTW